MSASGIKYSIDQTFSNNSRIAAYYDFADTSYTGIFSGSSVFTGFIPNHFPAANTGLYPAKILNSTGSFTQSTGFYQEVLAEGKMDFTKSNLEIPCEGLNFSKISAILDFEFKEGVHDGILFGSLEKTSDIVGGQVISGSRGFNIGINGRGKPFLQSFGENGDSIQIFNNVELSKRNILSFSIDGNLVELACYDFLNGTDESVKFTVDSPYLTKPDSLFLGGSKTFYRSSEPQNLTFSGYLNEFIILSGFISKDTIRDIGSGIVGEYFENSGSAINRRVITGYSNQIVYKEGVTGYTQSVTGQLTITTGYAQITGSSPITGDITKSEGDRIFKYYSFDNGSYSTFYKEEVGFLESGVTSYAPTGEGAYDTLGLSNYTSQVSGFLEATGVLEFTTTINLFETGFLTGLTDQISGTIQTPLYFDSTVFVNPSSGISINSEISGLRKNFIYYLGKRT